MRAAQFAHRRGRVVAEPDQPLDRRPVLPEVAHVQPGGQDGVPGEQDSRLPVENTTADGSCPARRHVDDPATGSYETVASGQVGNPKNRSPRRGWCRRPWCPAVPQEGVARDVVAVPVGVGDDQGIRPHEHGRVAAQPLRDEALDGRAQREHRLVGGRPVSMSSARSRPNSR